MMIMLGKPEDVVDLFLPVSQKKSKSIIFKKFQAVQRIVKADLVLVHSKNA